MKLKNYNLQKNKSLTYKLPDKIQMKIDKKIAQYYGLSEADLDITMKSYVQENFAAKSYFLGEGKIADKIGYVKSGIFRSFFFDNDANEITTQFYPEGSLIIAFDSFNNQTPSKENIIAAVDSELMVVSYKRQKELYELVPAWNQICKDLADQISKEMIERSIQFQTMSATERYQEFFKQYPSVIQRVALKHIASYLGIDIATLSRIRKNCR